MCEYVRYVKEIERERKKQQRRTDMMCVCALSLIFYPDCPFLSMKTSTVIIKI